jgi:hypothetical protein
VAGEAQQRQHVIDRLYTAPEIAEQLGCSLTYVRSTLRKLQIKPAGNRERSATYSPEQVEALRKVHSNAKPWKRRQDGTKASPTEKANAKMLHELATSERSTEQRRDDYNHHRQAPLDPAERAVVWQAWLDGSIGPLGQWSNTEPPASYRLAWEARETALAAPSEEEEALVAT